MSGVIVAAGPDVLAELYQSKTIERTAEDQKLAQQAKDQYALGEELAADAEIVTQKAENIWSILSHAVELANEMNDEALFMGAGNDSTLEKRFIGNGSDAIPLERYSPHKPGQVVVYTEKVSPAFNLGEIKGTSADTRVQALARLSVSTAQDYRSDYAPGMFRWTRSKNLITKPVSSSSPVVDAVTLSVTTQGDDTISLGNHTLHPAVYEGLLKRKDGISDFQYNKNMVMFDEEWANQAATTVSKAEPIFDLVKASLNPPKHT